MKIKLVSIGLNRAKSVSLEEFTRRIKIVLSEVRGPAMVVLPEYCWGENLSEAEILESIQLLQEELDQDQYLISGSFAKKIGSKRYNTSLIVSAQEVISENYKTHTLSDEEHRSNVVSGKNTGTIQVGNLRIAVIICADIWDSNILNRLIKLERADILLVPAFTVVPVGFSDYAKTQWYSLAIVRSREYLIPIVVADHSHAEGYAVGKASCIANPALKKPGMSGFQDFLHLPTENIVTVEIDMTEVQAYRQYRIAKGLYSEEII